jgi:tetratricopeptide (TPR) repeat protein
MFMRLIKRVRPRLLAGLVALVLALSLASCAERPIKPPPTPTDPKRVCLWLLWSKGPGLIKQAQALMAQGKPFQVVAIDLARNNPGLAKTNADCMDTGQLEVELAHALDGLKLGQVSEPFEIDQGFALAMRTSDRFRRKAKALYDQGKYEQAARELRLDLDLHPAAAGSWHLLALCLSATGDKQGAVQAFERALEWTPRDPTLLNDKATTLQAMGRGDEALKLYRQALDREPDNPVFMNNLAWALVQEDRDLAEAEKLAARAARQAADQASIWDTLGQVQQARGRHPQAVISFYRALRLDPNYPRVRARLTRSLVALTPAEVERLAVPKAPAPPPPKAATPVKASPPAKAKVSPPSVKPPKAVAQVKPPESLRPPAQPKPAPAKAPPPPPQPAAQPAAQAEPAPLKVASAPPPAKPKPVAKPKPKLRDAYRPPPKLAPKLLPKPVAGPKPTPPPTPTTPPKPEPVAEPVPVPPPPAAKPVLASRAVAAAGSGGSKVKGRVPQPPPEPKPVPVATPAPQPATPASAPRVEPLPSPTPPVPLVQPAPPALKPRPAPTPAKVPAPVAAQAQPVASQFFVQVASFKSHALAAKGAKHWQRAGYACLVRSWPSAKGTWHRVLLGPHDTKKQALDQARELTDKGLINFFVINKYPE